jgi:hypothetical protein
MASLRISIPGGWRDAQWLMAVTTLPKIHGSSQPSVIGSDALFWCVSRQQQCTHIHKNKHIFLRKELLFLPGQSSLDRGLKALAMG